MFPALRHLLRLVRRFFWNESSFVTWTRAFLMTLSASGIAFAKQVTATLGPIWGHRVEVLAVLGMGFSLMFAAGEKNAQPPKAATAPAANVTPVKVG